MKPHKLYVVVRDDLSSSQKAVQAGHALAEYVLHSDDGWKNGTLVYLTAPCIDDVAVKLQHTGVKHFAFHEPDINNQMTAIASLGTNNVFKNLSML